MLMGVALVSKKVVCDILIERTIDALLIVHFIVRGVMSLIRGSCTLVTRQCALVINVTVGSRYTERISLLQVLSLRYQSTYVVIC